MKLRTKIIITLAVTWMVTLVLVYLDFVVVILNDYKKLEQIDIAANYVRTQETFNRMFDSLVRLTSDWGHWDDVYQFIKHKNNSFIEANMTSVSFQDMNANFILFYDAQKNFYFGQAYSQVTHKWIEIPKDLLEAIQTNNLLQVNDIDFHKSGFVKTKSGYVLLSSVAVTDSIKKAMPNGNIIIGYFFDENKFQSLQKTLQFKINFLTFESIDRDAILKSILSELRTGKKYFALPKNKETMDIYSFIMSVNDEPIGIYRMEMRRNTYLAGIKIGARYMLILVVVGIFMLFLMWIALKIILLSRLSVLKKTLQDISTNNDFSKLITIGGKDEISEIARISNEMLRIIELTQNQLKHRLSLNTEEMEQLSKLNKNLSEEINRHLSVEKGLEKEEKELQQKAYYDLITGLPNRIFFSELLSQILANGERKKIEVAVLFLDLDKFKDINDIYGHHIGDVFLKHVAEVMNGALRKEDAVGRIGGDEFLFYINDVHSIEELNEIVARILESVRTPLVIDDKTKVATTASIGISIYPRNGVTAELLIANADSAMYYAKKQGGNSWFYYDNIMKKMY